MGEMKIKVIIYINIKLEMNICFKWSMKIIPYPVSTTIPKLDKAPTLQYKYSKASSNRTCDI